MALSCHMGKRSRLRDKYACLLNRRPCLLTAGGRNRSVQTQIFDHLTVVVEAVAHSPRGQRQAGRRAFTERILNGCDQVFLVDA
jgi:hypothetical protein